MAVEFCRIFRTLLMALVMVSAACTSIPALPMPPSSASPVSATGTPPTATFLPTPTPALYPWTDENAVMSGLCFESVNDAAGRTFAIQGEDDLRRFFDLADNSQLCRHPVQRGSFDFTGNRLLIGLWSKAIGCTARHDVSEIRRDDVAQTYVISLRLVVEIGCNYELVRPFWIGLSGLTGYDVRLLVQAS